MNVLLWYRAVAWPVLMLLVAVLSALEAHPQVIDFVDPPYGSPGERVIINGSGFTGGALTVRFGGPNGARDTTAQATSSSIIWARVPQGATTGPIYVQVGSQSALSLQDFLVLGPGPFITAVVPILGQVNQNITIRGWHLTNLLSVKFAGTTSPGALANANGTEINARVPAGATNGPITVTTSLGSSNTPFSFTVIGPGPYIAGFDPNRGAAGTPVTIDGVQFTQVTNVMFGALRGANLFVQSDIRMVVDAPQGVTTCRIAAQARNGAHTNSAFFYVPPVITGFSPTNGRAATNITIFGTNFTDTISVQIGGLPATLLASTNNNTLLVAAPEGTPSGPVRVNAPAGSAITSSNFSFLPLITGFSPIAGPTGTVVTVSGRNLDEGFVALRFGGVAAPTNSPPLATQIVARVPGGALTGPLSVTTSNGVFTTTNLFYLPATIASFSPSNSAPGSSVVINGVNLLGTTNVTFGGVPAAFTPATVNTQLLARVPTNVVSGPIAVSTPAGTATFGRFHARPIVDGFTPDHGVPGTDVVILGTNFLDASAVTFSGLSAPGFNVVSNGGAILAKVPAGAFTGPIAVTGPAGTGTTVSNFVVDLASDLSIHMESAPGTVFVTSNLVYTITVTNLGPSDASGVEIEDVLPSSLQLLSNLVTQGSITVQTNRVRAQVGNLPATRSATLMLFTAPRNFLGPLQNTASVQGAHQDLQPANNSASATVQVLPLPFLKISPYSPDQWMLSWPLALSDFALQYRAAFGTNPWLNHPTVPNISGTNKFIIEATVSGSKFYRLRGPAPQ